MLTSITPLGERAKGNRWSLTAAAYVVGSLLGGAALGLLGGVVGRLIRPVVGGAASLVLLAVTCVAAAVWDLRGVRPPSWRRQVDEQWLQAFRGWVYGAGFGLQLGFGLATIVTSASTYAVVAATVLVRSVPGGVAIGATFGLARGLALLAAHDVRRPEDLSHLHRRLADGARTARTATVVALLAGGAASVVLGVTS